MSFRSREELGKYLWGWEPNSLVGIYSAQLDSEPSQGHSVVHVQRPKAVLGCSRWQLKYLTTTLTRWRPVQRAMCTCTLWCHSYDGNSNVVLLHLCFVLLVILYVWPIGSPPNPLLYFFPLGLGVFSLPFRGLRVRGCCVLWACEALWDLKCDQGKQIKLSK